MTISVKPSGVGYTLDRARQCRARGHVYEKEEIGPEGEWRVVTNPTQCLRCGELKDSGEGH